LLDYHLDFIAARAIRLQLMFRTSSSLQTPLTAVEHPLAAERRTFATALFAVLLLLFCMTSWKKTGDFSEYGIMTIAVASHGTPDIRLSDIQKAKRLNPEPVFHSFYQGLEDGVRAHADAPAVAFYRSKDERYYAIHFFAYSAIAAVPFAVFEAVGIPPFKCYQFVNLAFIYLLGMTCFAFFGSIRRATAALGLFFLCGGALYWNWSSAEAMSAASLLAGLMLYLGNAPLLGAALVGLASMQNPPLVLFAGFAPVLQFLYLRNKGSTVRAAWTSTASAKNIAALAILVLLFLLPIAFNLVKFGMPSLIAAASTNPKLISGIRLFSFFFDLNQGMIVGVPALFAVLAWLLVSAKTRSMRLPACTALLFSAAMAIPALSTHNWNSGAAGMMRYAFWAAMPLLFVCLLQARDHVVPRALILAVFVVQAGTSLMERTYGHVEFNRIARFALANIPSAYNPVFEVFAERLRKHEGFVPKDQVLYYKVGQRTTKIAFNLEQLNKASREICGKNRELSLDKGVALVDDGWAYLNTTPACIPKLTETLVFGARDFDKAASIGFARGWGNTEFGGGNWDGRWTVAPAAQFSMRLPADTPYSTLTLCGQYVGTGMETDVSVNGHYLGRHALNRCLPIAVPADFQNKGNSVVELRHIPENIPTAANGDSRQLGFFLSRITLQ
jgi:hypothetical protein